MILARKTQRQHAVDARIENYIPKVRIGAFVTVNTFDEIQRMAIRRGVSVSMMIAAWLVAKAEEDRPID